MRKQTPKKRLVLVGGGHVHLLSLKYADQFIRAGAEVILIAPGRFHYYSGMGPGMISRIYKPEQVRFDVQNMVESRGGVFVRDKVVSIDPTERTLSLQGGEEIPYDLVSFNIGSYVPTNRIPGAEGEGIPVKPIENLESARKTILRKFHNGVPRILLIGAGPAGVELAGNIWRLSRVHNARAEIALASSRDRVLPNLAEKVGRLAEQSLSQRGIEILSNFHVASMGKGLARSQNGLEVPYDVAILTLGIVPHRIFVDSGLESSEDGGLLVNDYLQSTSSPEIFGGGDCITIKGKRLHRVGVYAVREAPILFRNLLATLREQPLNTFKPQKRYLLILNLGDGSGLLVWGSWVWKGRLAFSFKNYLDTSFMAKFQISGETR
ncbi:MAG: FAD-dependent oxidoreductase [Proteobacteria bacterium]|nr:FAD-dependent oxidoreductase [Pseudomonadota bacterium]